ncbi:extracellular solute-binding protein [Demequina mangrovi]|uniref:Putative spermidine/putrescine transport system substrate-binding protein n=1 Tax=Demequina mangrovi TaxID=1043493 RepID=A0A1H6ZX27_9MICO|nr:extracellular solute-binding protein [Demequina mangrovi]SEJ57206.1 putative spermidine/putrescine transport system substrate-binding protein [Demequina mangrovi]
MQKSLPRTALRAGIASMAVASLAACGTSSSDSGSEALESLGDTEGSVSILAWPGYVEDGTNDPAVDWVSSFEEATGCMVEAKTYGTSDEAYQLMQSGGYDVVAASGDLTLRLVAADLVSPVNTDLLESYEGIFGFLKDKEWNSVDGVAYGVPHGYGANLLMFNTEEVSPAPTSWDVVFDKASDYDGKVTAYDSPIYIADAAVYLMTHSPELGIENPYALDEDQFAAAVELLKTQKESVGEYWSDYLKEIQAFESGDSVVGTTWQVIQNSISTGTTDVVLPEEGATGWSDTWMIASETEAPNCAYAWLDHIASPEINATATAYFGEAPSSEAACDFRDDCEAYHAGDEEYASQIWYWTTPVSDCVDGREDVECVDYSEWTKAWQEIKG